MRCTYLSVLIFTLLLFQGPTGTLAADLNGGRSPGDSYWNSGGQKFAPSFAAAPQIYIRGDLGLGIAGGIGLVEDHNYPMTDEEMDLAASIGVGLGRQFSSRLRGDLTLDWRMPTEIKASQYAWGFNERRKFEIQTLLAMANLYIDFPRQSAPGFKDGQFTTDSRFTPYVGMGIGIAYHRADSGRAEVAANDFNPIKDKGQARFAYTLMAGLDWRLNSQTSLDFGYRFVDMGSFKSGGWNNEMWTWLSTMESTNLQSHEVRMGLRYKLR
ncbi:MAG: outer membrane protein [Methyloligellaceae bacterium]